jgi:phospholipid transport system substrate-binding protein
VAAEVIQLIKTSKGPQLEAGIRAVLTNYFNMPYMGQAALGTHWNQASPEQRERFLKAVTNAEARAYTDRFSQYGGQTLTVTRVSQRPNGTSIVDSKLNQSNGQPIAIQWEVRDSGSGLRITDVKIEGVSMVMTRRSDFNSYISGHGGKVEPLIDELEARAPR